MVDEQLLCADSGQETFDRRNVGDGLLLRATASSI